MQYNPGKIEKKWQKIWEESGIYQTPNKVKGKRNFYHLVMLPYSSGDLHIGHWYNYAPGDVFARFKRMFSRTRLAAGRKFNVLSPIGFDAFGLPAENAAIEHRIHPKTWTYQNIKRMRKQLRTIGACYDWSREILTCDPEYYKWTQWMFLQFLKAGLAYRAKVPANFCPKCKTVLANEQVVEGKCERCETEVIQKEIEQWLFKITNYAEDLLKELKGLDWPETTKTMQRNWIGKSCGVEITFPLATFARNRRETENTKPRETSIKVFTTRIDTLFGCTYLVLAPEHPFVASLLKIKNQKSNIKYVEKYIEESKKKTERERISEIKEKTGIEIKGVKAINPANKREIPIWVAGYVLMHYGTGAIMGVPAHDQRDLDFARKYDLPIIPVIKPYSQAKLPKRVSLVVSNGRFEEAYEGEGFLINSGRFTGMRSEVAKKRIVEWLGKKGMAKKMVCYKLRDWIISRQRYWGAPIPIVFCQKCGWQPVPEKDLPVLLPRIKDFRPIGEGKSPLAKSKKFVETICPRCKGPGQRETDTMDTFICSSWYYLRYVDPKNEKEFAAKQKLRIWLPVDIYIGGAEHAVMHLLYSRFFTKVLRKLDYLDFSEPFLKLRHQGIILGPDGQKMSKSRGNIIDPDKQVRKYGSDAVRMYLCFMGPYEQGGPWQPKGIVGIYRFLQRVWNLAIGSKSKTQIKNQKIANKKLEKLLHKTIKKVTDDIENLRFNTAISALMILVNEISKQPQSLEIRNWKLVIKLLAPFAPHLTEELWSSFASTSAKASAFGSTKSAFGQTKSADKKASEDKHFHIKNSVHNQPWPKYNRRLIKEKIITLIIQVNGKVRDKIEVKASITKGRAQKLAISREKIKKWIEGKKIKKVIFVPGKLINLVI